MRPCIQLVCQGYGKKKLNAELEHHLRKEEALQQDIYFFGSFPKENSLTLAKITPNQEMAEDIYFFPQFFICWSVPENLFIGHCNHFQGNQQLI